MPWFLWKERKKREIPYTVMTKYRIFRIAPFIRRTNNTLKILVIRKNSYYFYSNYILLNNERRREYCCLKEEIIQFADHWLTDLLMLSILLSLLFVKIVFHTIVIYQYHHKVQKLLQCLHYYDISLLLLILGHNIRCFQMHRNLQKYDVCL